MLLINGLLGQMVPINGLLGQMVAINGVSLSKLSTQVQALLQALLWLLCFKWELELELSSD